MVPHRLVASLAATALLLGPAASAHAQSGIKILVPNSNNGPTPATVSIGTLDGAGGFSSAASITDAGLPADAAVRADQRFGYVANGGIEVIDLSTNAVVQSVAIVDGASTAIAVDQLRVYVAVQPAFPSVQAPWVSVYTADRDTGQLTLSIPAIPVGASNNMTVKLAVNPSGSRVFALNQHTFGGQPGSVTAITVGAYTTTPIATGGRPTSAAFLPDGTLFVGDSVLTQIWVIDTAPDQLRGAIPIGVRATSMVVHPDGQALYVTMTNGIRVMLTQPSLTIVQDVPSLLSGAAPTGVALSPDGSYLYVSHGGNSSNPGGVTTYPVDATTHLVGARVSTITNGIYRPRPGAICQYGSSLLATGQVFAARTSGDLGCLQSLANFTGGTLQMLGTTFNSPVSSTLGAAGGTIDTTGTATLSGNVSGAGSMTKTGTGTLVLNGTNSYTGATNVNQGSVMLSSLSDQTAVTIAAGATLQTQGTVLAGGLSGSGQLTLATGTLELRNDSTVKTFSGTTSGAGGLIKSTTGILTLSGTSSHSGGISVTNGLLILGSAGAAGSNPLTIGAGTLNLGGFTRTNSLSLGDGALVQAGTLNNAAIAGAISQDATITADITGTSSVTKSGAGALYLAGVNTYSGATNVTAGTLFIKQSLAGNVTNNGSLTFYGPLLGPATGTISGAGSVSVAATGVVTLSGANTYTGTTFVQGRLFVTGSTSTSSSVLVSSSTTGILGGSGTIGGPVTLVGTNARLTPGDTTSAAQTAGILRTGSLALFDGSQLFVDLLALTPGASDQMAVTGAVTLFGSIGLNVNFGAGIPTPGQQYVIVNNDGGDAITGAFAGLPEGATFPGPTGRTLAITYKGGDGNDIVIMVQGPRFAIGAGLGGAPVARTFMLGSAQPLLDFNALPGNSAGGASVAMGDVDNDGLPEMIVGAGPGGTPEVKVYDQAGAQKLAFNAYDVAMALGVEVAAGDLDGDGVAEIVTAAGINGPSLIRVFSGQSGALLRQFDLSALSPLGGMHVGIGDTDAIGRAHIIVGAATGAAPLVQVRDGLSGALKRQIQVYDLLAGPGINVAGGDLNGDGYADIITGPGPGGGPLVRVFDGRTGSQFAGPLGTFYVYTPGFGGGVRVAASDLDRDGYADLIVGPGAGGGPHVKIFSGATGAERFGFYGFDPSYSLGVYVGGSAPMHRMSVDVPSNGATVAGAAVRVAGWALDESSAYNAGIDAIHAWAYPVAGGSPLFIGAATASIPRPDVAGIIGGEFINAGFDLTGTLPAGVYDVAVFVRSTKSQTVTNYRVVRITVQ